LFGIEVTAAANAPLDRVERAIYAEIERLKNGPIADAEIERARNAARRQFMGTISSSLSLARNLAEYALYYGDPGRINTRWDRLASLNAADVQRVAREYFTPENRTVIVSVPGSGTAKGGAQ
jgi:predicted Zn-dependent peptidase